MNNSNTQGPAVAEATRLLVGNLPYSAARDEIAQAISRIAAVRDVYLSKPRSTDQQNGGWAIVAVDEADAREVMGQTILIGDRVTRIKRARPKSE